MNNTPSNIVTAGKKDECPPHSFLGTLLGVYEATVKTETTSKTYVGTETTRHPSDMTINVAHVWKLKDLLRSSGNILRSARIKIGFSGSKKVSNFFQKYFASLENLILF